MPQLRQGRQALRRGLRDLRRGVGVPRRGDRVRVGHARPGRAAVRLVVGAARERGARLAAMGSRCAVGADPDLCPWRRRSELGEHPHDPDTPPTKCPLRSLLPRSGAITRAHADMNRVPRKEEAMRAVDALMECLKAEGVDVVFGLPGGANLPTYDAFYDAGIRHILVRHEAGGGHAAEGYAKATGKVGVSLGTSGPGATNLVTPICDAMMDSVPVVFLTGQVRTELLGTDGFQEADTIGITMPHVKHSFIIQHPLELPRSIPEPFHIARTGRPGPVVVDIPQDLSRADIPYEPVADVRLPGYQPTTEGNQKQIRIAAKALANARRPIIYAGGGVVASNAGAELTELATSDRFPVTCTVMGLGAFPGTHDQWLGMLGMHGTRSANYAMDEGDLIVAMGPRFG